MSRITNNVSTLLTQQNLAAASRAAQQSMERLSTGLRINQASDDPVGLIGSETLANQAAALTPAINQAQQAGNLIATADGALAQISNLLLSIQQLVGQAANTGANDAAQIAANQVGIDGAVNAIRQLVANTQYAGHTLLNGSLDITNTSDGSVLTDVVVSQGTPGTRVLANVAASGLPAALEFRSSQTNGSVQLKISTRAGSQTLNFASATAASAIVFGVNQAVDRTGVSAVLLDPAHAASGVRFSSRDLGSNAFVTVQAITGDFATTTGTGSAASTAHGADAVVTINGAAAQADGNDLTVNSPGLALTAKLATGLMTPSTVFAITGRPATFVAGPNLAGGTITVGIGSADPAALGNAQVGFLADLATGGDKALAGPNASDAASIVAAAINQVATLRGRLGSQASSLEQSVTTMSNTLVNVQSNESAIRDTDFAAEASALARAQLLRQAATSVLAMSNAQRQYVLQLLGTTTTTG